MTPTATSITTVAIALGLLALGCRPEPGDDRVGSDALGSEGGGDQGGESAGDPSGAASASDPGDPDSGGPPGNDSGDDEGPTSGAGEEEDGSGPPGDEGDEGDGSTGAEMGPVIFQQDFEADPLGPYTLAQLAESWLGATWGNGISEGRVEVFTGGTAFDGQSLRVHYPAGGFGSNGSGGSWWAVFDDRYDELWVSYRLRFSPGFAFVNGGMLPGLVGGVIMSDGVPAGDDEMQARSFWTQGGEANFRVYHMDQSVDWGDTLPWDHEFDTGQWISVVHHVRLNTPGETDGLLEAWYDGQQSTQIDGLRFRTVDTLGIDRLFFSTFHSGNNVGHAPVQDQTIEFDDFVVSTEPL